MASSKIEEAIKSHIETVNHSLAKNGLTSRLVVTFPNNKPPLLGKLGVWLVNVYGGKIATQYAVENGNITNKEGKKSR